MAISFTQTPQAYTPAYNDQYFTALSTLASAHADFVYLVTVTTPMGITSYKYPKRADNYGVFNVMEPVKNAIKRRFNPNITTAQLILNKSIPVTVVVTETYSGGAYSVAAFSFYAFDACLKEKDFRTYNYMDYVSGFTNPVSFLSPNLNDFIYPKKKAITKSDVWLCFYLGNVRSILVTVYNEIGVAQSIIGPTAIPSPSPTDIYMLNLGYTYLQANSAIMLNGWSCQVQFLDSTSTAIQAATFYAYSSCTKYTQYNVYYLKRNGSIGCFPFEKLSQDTVNKSTNTVRLSRYNLTAGVYGYNTYDAEKYVVSTQEITTTILNTNWLTQDESAALQELFDSTAIWIDSGSGYESVSNNEVSYQPKKHVNDKLIQYTMTIERSVQETRQRGI